MRERQFAGVVNTVVYFLTMSCLQSHAKHSGFAAIVHEVLEI